MKVGLVIASLGGGGAERIVLSLGSELINLGTDAHVMCLDDDQVLTPQDTIEIHTLSSLDSSSALHKSLAFLGQVRNFIKLAKKEKYTHYVSHMERANIVLMVCSFFFPVLFPRDKCVLTVHNHLGSSLKDKSLFKRLAAEILYRMASRLKFNMAFVSECARSDALKSFGFMEKRTSVLPNFVPVQDIDAKAGEPVDDEWWHLFDGPVILGVGRLSYQKGFEHLIRAFSQVAAGNEEARLVILGEGELKTKLVSLADKLGVGDRVYFPGFMANPFNWVRRADVFVMSSLFEGMPMILLEALACSAAIVSTDCFSGPREILVTGTPEDTTASKVEIHDCAMLTPPISRRDGLEDYELNMEEKALAEAIKPFIDDREYGESFREAAFKRAADFDINAGTRRWQSLLERI